jgi:hypothetical protein
MFDNIIVYTTVIPCAVDYTQYIYNDILVISHSSAYWSVSDRDFFSSEMIQLWHIHYNSGLLNDYEVYSKPTITA